MIPPPLVRHHHAQAHHPLKTHNPSRTHHPYEQITFVAILL